MYTSMWFMSIVAILMVDVRTGALLQRDTSPLQCYHCAHNDSSCLPEQLLQAPCPARGQHCATIALAPGFASTLTCATSGVHPCSLSYSKQTLQLTCTCAGHRCNAPFSSQLRNKLLNFTSKISNSNSTSHDLTQTFFKSFGNVSTKLYDIITVKAEQEKLNKSQIPAHVSSTINSNVVEHFNDFSALRAEALKQETTEPSDDEEDESEGSGSYDETRLRRPAAAPAAPSSFLPANENTAPPLLTNCILLATMLFVIL